MLNSSNRFHLKLIFGNRLGPTYPDHPPEMISVSRRRIVSTAQAAELQTILEEMAKTLVGSEMIFELAERVKVNCH